MKNKKTKLTPEVMLRQLTSVQELINNSKIPVRSYHLMSNSELGTTGIISAPVLNVLRKNKILTGSKKTGYLWNPKIPVTYKLAQTIVNEYEKYRDYGYSFEEKANSKKSCQNHAVEQEKQETVKPEKRVYTKKVKPPLQVKEGWFKRAIRYIFNIK